MKFLLSVLTIFVAGLLPAKGELPGTVDARDLAHEWVGHNDAATLVIKLHLMKDGTGKIYYSKSPGEFRVYEIKEWHADNGTVSIQHTGRDRSFQVTQASKWVVRLRVLEGVQRSIFEMFRKDRLEMHLNQIEEKEKIERSHHQ